MISKRLIRFLVIAFTAFFISSCGTAEVRMQRQSIAIARDVNLVLPLADELNDSFNAIQSITAEHADRSYSFEAHIEVRPGKIAIVALAPLGGALFSIIYDGTDLVASGSAEAQLINAEYVLADVLLVHWDVDWLNRRIEGAVVDVAPTGNERFVARDGDLIIGVSYESSDPWGGAARLTHIEREYVLQIRTAEFSRQ